MTTVNRRGMYFAPTHGRQADWDFLREWQPSVVRLMLPGSHSDPNSVSLDMVQRVHEAAPDALIVLRVWDVDDRNGDAKRAMAADPEGFADEYHAWWKALFDRLPAGLREQCMAGSVNEPWPDQFGPLKPFTRRVCRNGTRDNVRYGVLVFSAGTPGKPGEGPHAWPYFADLEPDIVEGNHAVMLHEYMQPEGMYGEWIDAEGNHRSDYENLISRHHHCPYTEARIILAEWGIEGILYNRHPDPMHGGHAGWQYFPGLWPASRYADEYVACVQDASPNVIAICPFISDWKDKKWRTADLLPAYDEFLARKQDCVGRVAHDKSPDPIHNGDSVSQDDHSTHLPNIQSGNPQPTAAPEQPPLVISPDAEMEIRPMILDPLVMEAFIAIESGGRAFGPDGKLLIRFEAHVFVREARGWQAGDTFTFDMDKPWTDQHMFVDGERRPIHTGNQADEWAAFEVAARMDPPAAYRAISMGAPQIVGFNHARIGYGSAEQMFEAFQRSEHAQIIGLVNYMLSDPQLVNAIQQRDWLTMATLYNGSGAAEHYAGLLKAKYDEL